MIFCARIYFISLLLIKCIIFFHTGRTIDFIANSKTTDNILAIHSKSLEWMGLMGNKMVKKRSNLIGAEQTMEGVRTAIQVNNYGAIYYPLVLVLCLCWKELNGGIKKFKIHWAFHLNNPFLYPCLSRIYSKTIITYISCNWATK